MADITMCKDATCPNAQTCYRFKANVNPYGQYFFINSPLKEDKTCDEYWKVKEFTNES